MNLFKNALAADINGRFKDSILLYEYCAAHSNSDVEVSKCLLNLLLIYWQCTFDYGLSSFCLSNGFTENDINNMYDKFVKTMDTISIHYNHIYECEFWVAYITEEITNGEKSAEIAIGSLIANDPINPLGYLYLSEKNLGINYSEFANKLYSLKIELAIEGLSFKNRYVINKIDSITRFNILGNLDNTNSM